MVSHAPYWGKALKTVRRNAEARWRGWAVVLAVALGILMGAVASGRVKLHIHW